MESPYYSFGKLLGYVGNVALHDFTVEAEDGSVETYRSPGRLVISPYFFRGDDCYRSGRCCRPYDVSWTKADWERVQESSRAEGVDPESLEGYQEMMETGFEYQIKVDGKEVSLFLDPVTNKDHKSKKMCDQLRYDENGVSYCAIRNINSITCRMPHSTLQLNSRSNTAYLQKKQFGRNHQLGCPVKFKGFSMEGFLETDIPLLERLERTAEDLGVETYVPNLLKILWGMKEKLGEGLLPLASVTVPREMDEEGLEEILEGIKWGAEGQEPENFRPENKNVFIPVPTLPERLQET